MLYFCSFMSFLLHLVSSHRSLISIKQEQVDIIFPTTYEKYCVWGISDIYWCGKNSIFDAKSKTLLLGNHMVPSCHISFFLRHFHICIIFNILDDVLKFLFLFLITLTIPLLSLRNYSFTNFLAWEKIKEILSRWKKVIFSDSVISH